jgi:histidine triad (HIT) family protein
MPTIFERIVSREIPAEILYEDDLVAAFRDIEPQAPFHVLVVPKRPLARLAEATAADAVLLGQMLIAAERVARDAGVSEAGYRLVLNDGPDAGQLVPHVHMHLLAGRKMGWPPG